jgi:hypothetical protein
MSVHARTSLRTLMILASSHPSGRSCPCAQCTTFSDASASTSCCTYTHCRTHQTGVTKGGGSRVTKGPAPAPSAPPSRTPPPAPRAARTHTAGHTRQGIKKSQQLEEGDPKGWSTALVTALGSWERTVPRGHLNLPYTTVRASLGSDV